MTRPDKRKAQQLRKIDIKRGYLKNADGSCFIECGNTKVLCAATLEEKVPHFMRNSKKGWLTAEYSMLPVSCSNRIIRDGTRGKISGRTHEIQRLIGRSLRAVIDFEKLGERTIWIDCDVIQGDGGTRTASITGAFFALAELVEKYIKRGTLAESVIKDYIAAVSVGIVNETILLDLCYEEDSQAAVDMNIVMTGSGKLIEIQGTAEGEPFSVQELNKLLLVAKKGITQIVSTQKKYVSL
ncbi:MAG: ribonuclease PH [Candidatus Omnitrophica bacterium]|nr:ribonuclease PH [Candidatus Omnitrophota bacterium]